ncbi:nucleotidyltransferase family protein [Bacteroides sp. GD17]|jgi:hypothetical protein|uniref:nucleotidyltransferase domain-containing protein n=1 Tax=Bacteroides sp. GD17 TaxID=3139826 RepID=UPI00313B9854
MTPIQKQFFALVQSGLWGMDIDSTLFDRQTDWQQLYQSAKVQALLGITFDGMQNLPKELHPARELYLKWCNSLLQIEENNHILNRELANVYALYRANGIEPVLLKGQGVAQNYRIPLHRQCGDIDLYIGPKNYKTANKLLRQEATGEHEENHKHTCIHWHGVDIENHRVLSRFSSPSSDGHFQREIARWHNTAACRNLEIEGCRVTLPPLSFDVAYVLAHSTLHFLNEGIGLRQVCDWANLLHARREEIDRKKTAKLLRQWGLSKAARVFGVVAVRYLGLPAEDLPIAYTEKDLKTGEWLFNDIWQGGNFGRYTTKIKQRPKGYWRGKWYTFTRATRRCREFGSLASAEARWYPLMLAVHSAQVQWNKLWNRN